MSYQRTYTKANGEVSEYNQKKYNKTWYDLHKEDLLKQRIDCPCGLSHLGSNKTNHRRGKVHKLWVRMNAALEAGEKAFTGKGFGSLIPPTTVTEVNLAEIQIVDDVSPEPLVLNLNLDYSNFGKVIVL